MYGWIKLHRSIWANPVVTKDNDYLAVWIYLLTNVVWDDTDVIFNNTRTTLKPGQLTTGRKFIAEKLHISESKVQRILNAFESEHQIEQVTDHKCRLISIVSWDKYQTSEQVNEQVVNKWRTSSEQVVNTNKEYKNIRNKEESYLLNNNNRALQEAHNDFVKMMEEIC